MLFLILFMIAVVLYLWTKRLARSNDEPPILPGALPFIGHVHKVIGDSKDFWKMIKRETQKAMSIANTTTFVVCGSKYYILLDPDDCLTVGNACLEKDKYYTIARPCFGDGLVTASTETWKEHRKLLSPKFNLNYLLSLLGVFNKQARILSKEFESYIDKGEFDHGYFIRHNEMRTICLTSIGLDFNNDKETLYEYENAFLTILNSYVEQGLNLWLHFRFFWRRSSLRIIRNTNRDIMHRIIDKIIERKKCVYDNIISRNSDEAGHFKPFLDVLFDVKDTVGGDVMNDKFIRDHVNTLIFAGHDTITLVMQVAMIVIGSYPAVQDKLYAELQEVFGCSDRDVLKDDLTKLIYMDAVLKETMRLYPIAPFLGRYIHRDIKLKNFTLKGGHPCFFNVYAVNRHPMWGRDAEHFKPERWLDASTLPSNPNAFMAFSIGKRNCLGRTYSMISMKATLAHVLRRYRINADLRKLQFKFEILLTPCAGANFKPFLDVLFELKDTVGGEGLTDKLIRDQINTLIMAGHDTVNCLQMTLILIGSHPKVQDKIYAELQEVFDNSDRDMEKDDLTKLIYLEAVLKESMRLYTVVPIASRRLQQDVKLKNYTLQRGHSCILNFLAVHRHVMWGFDAELFKPERWLNPKTLPTNPSAFLAFSLGKRNCIGRTYAMISMKTTLAHILRRYCISADDNKLQLKFELLVKPSAGHLITIE